ncbi:Calcium uniporter protein [Schistosoma japonicum]|uniref:Calcium uniporter protein n=1 Tax=Schistosoma japonicum TaxID=6182 RepID=A0A4Z2CZV4_SCHJA|nr:Calcium uniporter protein, mitochondrial [Schistosoma japonicum]TNN09430.1 Calcium uniporter protein [Schistosoma japonicum]
MYLRRISFQREFFRRLDLVNIQSLLFYSTSVSSSLDTVSVHNENGLPKIIVPLPSRREACSFILKPLQHTVGDLSNFIKCEDSGVDRVTFFSEDGTRIAKSNSIADLLTSDFHILINDQKYHVDTSSMSSQFSLLPKDLANARELITNLANALHVDEFYAQKLSQLEKCIEDVNLQLEPFEKEKLLIAEQAAQRTRWLTWLGLGAMGVQFGLLARLTWWEYSWDIMEPVTYFVGYGTSMAMYAYYVITRQDYTLPQVFDREYLKSFYRSADKTSFDVQRYNELRDELAHLKSELRRLKDPLLHHLPLQQTEYLIPEQVESILNQTKNLPQK